MSNYETLLKFWFGDDLSKLKDDNYAHKSNLWFHIKYDTDELIKNKFEKSLKDAINGKLEHWKNEPQGCVALIILLDQFSRNMYRGTAEMFAYDSLASKLALDLVADTSKFESLSIVERFFVYLCLLHVEDKTTAKIGYDGIEKLANTCPSFQKKYFVKYFQSTKVHYGLLEKYNRYPHRNSLLGRESTEDELKFLDVAKYNFVKSVLPAKKPEHIDDKSSKQNSNVLNNEELSKIKKKTTATLPKQKLLFLHGFRQNSHKLKKRSRKVFRVIEAKCNANCYFLNGTHPYTPKGETADQIKSTMGKDILNAIESQRIWFNSDDSATVYYGIEESIEHVLSHVKLEGPYDGIIGFGQGAALAGIIVRLHPTLFRYFIAISSFTPRADKYKNLYSEENKFDFPSLHIFGKIDILITQDRSRLFANCFKNSIAVEHKAGHFAPDAWPVDCMIEFINSNSINMVANMLNKLDLKTFDDKVKYINDQFDRVPVSNIEIQALLSSDWSKDFHNKQIHKNENMSEMINKLADLMVNIRNEIDFHDYFILYHLALVYLKQIKSESYDTLFDIWLNVYNLNSEEAIKHTKSIFISCENWKEFVRLSYFIALKINSISNDEIQSSKMKSLFSYMLDLMSNQLRIDLKKLDQKQFTNHSEKLISINNQEIIGDTETEIDLNNISQLSEFIPRVKSAVDKNSGIAKQVAIRLNPIVIDENDSKKTEVSKIACYNKYRKVLSALNSFHKNLKSTLTTNPRTYLHLAKYDLETMKKLLDAPISDAIINPVPEPVDVSTLEQLQPLFDWLAKKEKVFENLPFLRGTVTNDGRLDLCKQVVGPCGIKPLLDSMQNNTSIDRLLLGNNIIGDGGGQVIADFIKSGKSPLTIWYIAGNHFSANGIKPIAEALKNDQQVNALWLKRNPLKAAGMIHIADLLRNNNKIEVLDLLNCGLLDEGISILFEGLKLNQTIRHLYLSANGITPTGLKKIAEYLMTGKSTLQTLFLGSNRIGDEGAKILSEGLKYDKTLQRLNLTSSRIGPLGMKYLTEAFETHPTIELVDLGYQRSSLDLGEIGNFIQDEGASYIAKLIEKNTPLKSLNITHNHITQKGLQKIVDALKTNTNLLVLEYIQYGISLNEITLTDMRNYLKRNRKLINEKQPDFNMDSFLIPDHVAKIYSVYRTH